jgi:dihydrofolate reductase
MKTQYYTATSLDGFIATADHSLDWLDALGITESSYPEFIADIGALAMGSGTYEWLLRNQEQVAKELGSSWPYPQPTWVLTSRELPAVPGADVRFARGDVSAVHAEMSQAAAGKNLWVVGGGDLAGQFFEAKLLDELIVQVASVTLGSGKPLFPRRAIFPVLQLQEVRQMGTRMVELRYSVSYEKSRES